MFGKRILVGSVFALLLSSMIPVSALSVAELRQVNDLTPEKFANYFSEFEFKFHEEVQGFDTFLSSRSGDCDDYSTVAAELLKPRGYTPRLIAVRMKGETHVICYVNESKGYLDYNCRKDSQKIVPCGPKITEIARSVAKSFDKDWVATYEFSYSPSENVKRLVNRIIPNNSETAILATSSARLGK
ncbi:MAG: hypothetical protein JWM68_5047 [Verrucomicrobiales bacterium]|nr:hypothetical protein [Verrucomicrobiales bacterium]